MLQFNNALVVDLSSYGSALAIINQFCDDEQVKAFEISPVGTAALLILTIKEAVAADLIQNEIISFFKAHVLSIKLIKNISPVVLKTYLSQTQEMLKKFVLVQEFSFLSEAFESAQGLVAQEAVVIDFRVIRTYPMNIILISSSDNEQLLLKIKETIRARTTQFITQPNQMLQDYFGVIKS